jgi:lysophospholipase L1-like esterase
LGVLDERSFIMRKRTVLLVVACAMLGAATICVAQADRGAAAPAGVAPGAPGGARRGGGFSRGAMQPPGPPAPVPSEVAMLRPTSEEVAKMNEELQKFVNANTGANKDLLKKYASLITVQMPRDNPCIRPSGGSGGQHQSFVETAKNGDFDILFLGDSITYLWTVGEGDMSGYLGGKRLFDKYFGSMKVANFGIAGDTTQGVLWRLQNGEGQGHKPKAVMLMLGTNNTGGASGEEIAEGLGAVVLELRKDFPDAKIMLMAIFPRGSSPNDANRRKCETANKIIAKLHDGKHVFFTDINSKFLKEDGSLIGFRPQENLHPVEEGFDIWGAAVAPTLTSWIK